MGRFYITTPIYYVNDVPHLGTAYTTIIADALRRFHILVGDETFMLTGTDEHGLKIERYAKEEGLAPKEFTDRMSARFREAWPKLDVGYDRFIRTTDQDHEACVKDLSVSRTSFNWGISVPGNPKHVMYVWFDALANYRSALGTGELARFWAPNGKVVHLVGKDILRFHAVFWPAFLLSAGYTELE